jgi:DNA repair protein RecO (recombination protein O)
VPPVADDAVCLRHHDWSETSQTVVLMTRAHGLVRALAKGSKRPKAAFSGGVELLTRADVQLYIRPDKDLDLLGSWDLTFPYTHLRRSLAAFHAGLYVAEITARLLDTHDPHPSVFDALNSCIEHLRPDSGVPVAAVVLAYQLTLLADTGFAPRLDADARTGEPLPHSGPLGFDPTAGGVIPDPGPVPGQTAAAADPEAIPAGPWRVRRATMEALRLVDQHRDRPDVASDDAARAVRLLNLWIATRIGRLPVSSAPLLNALGPIARSGGERSGQN